MESQHSETFDINTAKTLQQAPAYPNLGQSWGLFGVFFAASVAIGGPIAVLTFVLNAMQLPLGAQLTAWINLASYIMTFAVIFLFAWFYAKGVGAQPVTVSRKPAPPWIYSVLIFAAPAMTVLVSATIELIPVPDFLKVFEETIKNMVQPSVPAFIMAVIAAPVCEEILCRGIILEGLLRNGHSSRNAILWSAFIFAALHMNPWQGVAAMAIGCLAGWLYVETRSLLPCIFIHFLNNGIAFAGLLALGVDAEISELSGDYYTDVLVAAACVLLACLYIFYRKLRLFGSE